MASACLENVVRMSTECRGMRGGKPRIHAIRRHPANVLRMSAEVGRMSSECPPNGRRMSAACLQNVPRMSVECPLNVGECVEESRGYTPSGGIRRMSYVLRVSVEVGRMTAECPVNVRQMAAACPQNVPRMFAECRGTREGKPRIHAINAGSGLGCSPFKQLLGAVCLLSGRSPANVRRMSSEWPVESRGYSPSAQSRGSDARHSSSR